ncbi:MAG: FAD binding domain-containing protein [Clostridia bacterium]|nr:FAD binding domain-containing protein [Clostridia bacterium]
MAKYKNYVLARSIEEAYELNQKKSSVIVAGNMWLRMCGMNKQTAVDLSLLGLDRIEKTQDGFVVGAMTTLRALETDTALNDAFGSVFARALAPIVGTQFRSTATVGGSVYSRFGFSDVSALLLALDAEVVLHQRGVVKLSEYQLEAWDRDIITHIRIPGGQRASVQSVRVSGTDIPTLVCAAAKSEKGIRIVLGARPARAVIAADGLKLVDAQNIHIIEEIAGRTAFGTNLRAGEAYRRRIAPVLMARAVKGCMECEAKEAAEDEC